jgi:UDP-2,3-diacylglucosamine hydrolase
VRLFHGDALGPGDRGYKVLKRILRNPVTIRMYRWIHPDLGIPFALRTSGVSRHRQSEDDVDVESLFTHVAVPALENGADAVLMGHHHVPVHWRRDEGEMLILGDWFRKFTCVRLRGGRFELLTWPLEG